MAGFTGFSSSFGSDFGEYHKPKPVKKSSSSHGLLHGVAGFFEHLGTDVRDAVVGLPMGFKNLATHPIESFKQIGIATWHDWSPLLTGHPKEFLKGFYAHPLAPILDVAGFVTAGAGTAARGASAIGKLEAVGKIGADSALVRAAAKVGGEQVSASGAMRVGFGSKRLITKGTKGIPNELVTRRYAANPVIRMRQKAVEGTANFLSEKTGRALPGSDARFVKKQLGRFDADRRAALNRQLFDSMKAARKMFAGGAGSASVLRELDKFWGDSLESHAYEITRSRLSTGSKRGLKKGFVYLADRKYWKTPDFPANATPEAIERWTRRWAKEANVLTDDASKAMVKNGRLQVVRTKSLKAFTDEAGHSIKALDILYNKPLVAWKWLVLANSPRFFVNNVVGNTAMYFFATNPAAAVQGLYGAYREVRGAAKARATMSRADKLMSKVHGSGAAGDVTNQMYAGVTAGLGGDIVSELGKSTAGATKQALRTGLYGVTHKVSEDMIRRATLHHAIKRTPEYWEARGRGLSHERAYAAASRYSGVREQMRQAVNNVLGDYNYLSKTEQAVKRVVPFYTWDRAIARHTLELAKNRPYEGAILTPIGEGGIEETRERLGHIPAFLEGAIPVAGHAGGVLSFLLGAGRPGRQQVLTTQGLNPYATVGEEIDSVLSIIGVGNKRPGETVGSQLNPMLVGGAEWLAGVRLLSGAPSGDKKGGLIGNVYGATLESTPQLKLLQTVIGGRPKPSGERPLLYRGDTRQQLLGLLGAPIKEMSDQTAEELYYREVGGKKSRRRRSPQAFSTLYDTNHEPGF